jgi:hypothetical protein
VVFSGDVKRLFVRLRFPFSKVFSVLKIGDRVIVSFQRRRKNWFFPKIAVFSSFNNHKNRLTPKTKPFSTHAQTPVHPIPTKNKTIPQRRHEISQR